MRYRFTDKIICPTLPRTGSRSLARALEILGFRFCHWNPERLSDVVRGQTPNPDFKRYDDVDAMLDIPHSLFYKEIMMAYPCHRVILTLRDEHQWWLSIKKHYAWVRENLTGYFLESAILEQQLAFGSIYDNEFMYKKRFREHQEAVMNLQLPPDRLLGINICAGEGWEKLCIWLNMPPPDCPFPWLHENRSMRSSDELFLKSDSISDQHTS